MRVCDWIAEYLHGIGVKNIYGLMGGGAAGLNDGFISNGNLRYVCFHHEQGAAHAATGEAKITGRIAVVNPTTGCGGTNCITSVLNAWQDGVPLLFISGNVRKDHCSRWINSSQGVSIRKYGIQEHDIISTVRSMTKFSVFADDPAMVPTLIKQAVFHATTGRPGPVWVDIPADIQTANLPNEVRDLDHGCVETHNEVDRNEISEIMNIIKESSRPIVLAGQGIKQSGTVLDFRRFVETHQIPVVTTYGGCDLLPYDHPLNIGSIGIKGSRAGNFAMQASDALLILGCSLNTSHIGYDPTTWAPLARRMMVDIDPNELKKDQVRLDHSLVCDLRDFFRETIGDRS